MYKFFKDLEEYAEPIDFSIICLEDATKFSIFHPWSIDIQSIVNYFGEKIGIYFYFL